MNITDIVRVKATGRTLQISGFFSLSRTLRGINMLVPCMPDDPLCVAVSGENLSREFHLPFDLEYVRPISLPSEKIEEARAKHRKAVERHTPGTRLTERDYPDILRPFVNISNHQLLQLEAWRANQAILFASEYTDRLADTEEKSP